MCVCVRVAVGSIRGKCLAILIFWDVVSHILAAVNISRWKTFLLQRKIVCWKYFWTDHMIPRDMRFPACCHEFNWRQETAPVATQVHVSVACDPYVDCRQIGDDFIDVGRLSRCVSWPSCLAAAAFVNRRRVAAAQRSGCSPCRLERSIHENEPQVFSSLPFPSFSSCLFTVLVAVCYC